MRWCLQGSLDRLRDELQATVAAKAAVLAAQEAGSSMAVQQEVRPCHAHTDQTPSPAAQPPAAPATATSQSPQSILSLTAVMLLLE